MLMCNLSVCLRAVLSNKQWTAVYQTTKLIINLHDITVKFTLFSVLREPTQMKLLVIVIPNCSEIRVQWELSCYHMGKELYLLLIIESWHFLLLSVGILELFVALTEWLFQTREGFYWKVCKEPARKHGIYVFWPGERRGLVYRRS